MWTTPVRRPSPSPWPPSPRPPPAVPAAVETTFYTTTQPVVITTAPPVNRRGTRTPCSDTAEHDRNDWDYRRVGEL
jgi:hypothetical protein